MRHAPENELGVVFLFSKVSKRLGFPEIDIIQPHFPDCWAYRRTNKGVIPTWIEFEFHSHTFKSHLKDIKKIKPSKGIVVCWDHDWKECEKYVEVIDLRSHLGLGRQVWIQNTKPQYQHGFDEIPRRRTQGWTWSVAPGSRPGDLLLMYRAGLVRDARLYEVNEELLQSISHICVIKSFPMRRKDFGYGAEVAQLVILKNPLRLEQMKNDRVLKSAPFVLRNLFGRSNVTPYWYRLYDLVMKLNPYKDIEKSLKPYSPDLL
ncbi:MAG TPA: hypothetical protein DCP92_10755 [Nitrospiraceae bacterium]|jgi:hypothetical protein|nr:hypothetical protein [Nitrospiraceae bacterium]